MNTSKAPNTDRFGIAFDSPTWLEDNMAAQSNSMKDFFIGKEAFVAENQAQRLERVAEKAQAEPRARRL